MSVKHRREVWLRPSPDRGSLIDGLVTRLPRPVVVRIQYSAVPASVTLSDLSLVTEEYLKPRPQSPSPSRLGATASPGHQQTSHHVARASQSWTHIPQFQKGPPLARTG